jgi:glycosyltransferase involved in cell wall biosynthesis
MEFHQVVVAAAPDDAVTNTALEYQRLLRRVCGSEIYAAHRHPALADDVRSLRDFASRPGRSSGDVLVVHLSIGDSAVSQLIDECDERLVLVYHNVTPPEYFEPYDPAFARLLREGRSEVARLADRADIAIGVSGYNAAELEALGYRDVRVVPLVVDVGGFRSVAPDPTLLDTLSDLDGPTFLYVGQILPHKRPDLLLEAYQVLVTNLVPNANLVLVGHARNRVFARVFRTQMAELSLPGARFIGRATSAQLAACFEGATAFVTASEHEGVCVPLLEAMSFDRPVVARDYGAIAETMGGAGVLLPADSGALLIAEALAELASSSELREDLAARGRRRLDDFDPDAARAAFLDVLLEVA